MGRAIVGETAFSGANLADAGPKRVREAAAYLRVQALTLSPRKIGIEAGADDDVLGLVIDAATEQRTTSLTFLVDGAIALLSDNGDCFVGSADGEVRWKCADMLQYAQRFSSLATPTQDLGAPTRGMTRFYFLTHGGPRVIEIPLVDLARIDERLGVLYFAAQRVIAALERSFASRIEGEEVDADQPAIDDGDSQCSSVGNAAPHWRS